MKSIWEKRILALEKQSRHFLGPQLLEEWIEKNIREGPRNYWEIANLVPSNLRAECIFKAIAEIKKTAIEKAAPPDAG